MAERPLYTLYKNLKAQNYDVPDDYNKFESALTRDGKGGADNRHAIYENLKAQNFDVPDTYERFYSALFEPRSKTSSRAKGGSVPMTAADRARFSAGAASISASAQQTMNNAGRYNRLKQRKQKHQKDFGRVNLGTHQTPFGGDANNVVKDDFAYNPETGKAGAYVTSDNDNVYSQNDAEQKQNLLDKYGEEWNNAVDMGIVPSELDKADPDLSDTDVAMRQMERRQEWLNENQDRRSNELNESMHLQGSPFVASGGAVAPSSFNTAISNEANRLSDVEYGAYNTAKAYNQMLRTTLLQELKEQKQRNENAGWWKDKWNDVSNYFGAMFNTMLDPKLYSQGVMDAAISNNLLQVKKGMEDGTIKKGSNAGNAAQAMLGAIQQQQGEAAKQQQYGTKAYQYGYMNGRSLKFMADFASSGWRNVMTTGFTKAGEKVGEKMALGALGKWFTKNTGRVLGDIAGSAALAATNQLGSTYNNVIERYVGMNNENGGVTQDKNGDLKFNEGVSLGKAIKDGFGSATIENFSEMFGEYLPGAPKLLSKLGLSKVSSFFEKIGNNAYYKWLSNATNKSGIQGVMAEISEEEFGTALHAAWGDGDGSWSDFNVFTNPDAREKQIDTCLGMFYSVGFMQAPRTAVGAINAVQYFNIKHQVAKADKFGQMMFNDKWDEIKSKIDVTTNADLTKTVLDATRSDSMTAKQKDAVINYAMFLSKLRGFNQAADAKTKDKVEEGDTAPTLSNDLDDAYTEGHNADDTDKHNIQLEQNDKANELAAMLHITPEQLHDMADEDLETMTGQNDKLDQAIYDYQVSTAKYQGVMDGAQDEVDMAAQQAAMETDNMTDLSRGTVRKATIKATGGLEDYEVYIISGNIATHDDGSIDVGNSDDMIIYYDPTTGRKEHADAMMFADLIEELPAADVKAQAINDAKENAIKKIAGIIDGTVEVGSQFSVTDVDGTEHTYEVLADNGDGTAMITIDGNVPTELVKGENVQIPYSFADLQQMKDAEDLKRLEAAKTEREQMEKERAAQQTEQTLPSFDFKEILNDNGNVVEADVIGKDGNSKFPNSKIFLIRNTGAKAKVVELKSDGTLKSHAVNKEDVQTATSMSLEEYKQARFGSSMIEDNSGENRGEIEVEAPTIEGEVAAPDNEVAAPESAETPATEQTPAAPAITLEDGTIVPMLEDGNPDFSKLTAEQTAELYDSQFGEDADSIVSGYVSDAKKALDKASNMTVKGKTFVEQKAAKDAKEKAIADAQAAYDSAIAIRDAYNERQLAKVEDTAEGRKNLIEKARRKFARLKSAVKDDAEAVAQLYKETVGNLLHRLYDGTGIDVTDTIPLTAEEYVASNLGAHSLNYEGTETSKGVKQETGLSREDFAKTQLLAADGKGTTIDALVHSLWENRPSNLESLDTQDIRNAMLSVITSGFNASEAKNYIENLRIAQAENFLEEQKKAADNAAFAEENKAEPEQQTETAPESEEKPEENTADSEKINEQTNENINASEQNKFPDRLKEGSKTIEVPEDATDDAPLGKPLDESDLRFSSKGNDTQQTTIDSDADVEKNKVDDVKVVDNIVSKKTRKTLEKIAKIMGANIQWLYSNKQFNGRFDEKTNTIYLTLDSSITEGVQFIFGHEMTHEMRTKNPAAYDELKTLVKDMMGEDIFSAETDKMQQRYKKGGARYWNNRNAIEEEVVADQLGVWIRDANYAHTLLLKMSHPLLARLHEIVNRFLMALHGTEFSDDMNLILRSIEQAYVKTANGQVTNSETGEDVSFSLRQKPEPKKKGIGYKVFVLKDGKLYPPMVANPNGAATPVGVWLDADAAPIAGESKTGRPQVKQGGKGTQGGSGKLAYRPGWHLGVVPYAIQFNRKDAEGNKTLFPKNFVFAEVEYAADVDYQEEARQEGINPSGKYQHSLAGLKHLPTDGYYMYRTNPNPETDPWVITGAMKVNRILTRAEQAELVKNAGREPQQIQEGDIVTDDVVNSINQEIADAPKFSLKVYHGSGADFTEFDFDHMGEGAGSQVFGWGGYVTSSKKIGKSYATLMDNDPSMAYYRIQHSNGTRFAKKYPTLESFLHGDKQIAMNDKFTEQEKIDFYNEMKKLAEPYHNLYEVDIPEDNGSNYLDWDKPLSKEQQDAIREGLEHIGVDIEKLESKGQSLERTGENVYNSTLYIGLTGTEYDLPERTKGISKFLSSVGFTGIKYKAGRNFGGAKKGDTNYVIFKPEDMRITEHTKFSIKTYHGSQASFDKFDHSFMGSGEGAQAYGWGTYVSEVEGIAKAYAKANAKKNAPSGLMYDTVAQDLVDTKSGLDLLEDELKDAKSYVDLYQSRLDDAKEELSKAKESGTGLGVDMYESDIEYYSKQVERYKQSMKTKESDIKDVKNKVDALQKKLDSMEKPRNLYSVDIPDDTGRNYIGWDEPLGAAKIMRLPKVFKADGWEYKKVGMYDTYKIDGNEHEVWLEPSLTTGKELYRDLTNALGSDKAASEFLSKAGFVGVKVIAQRNTGGNKEGKMNYVIFDENNAQITSHTKFSLKDPFKMSDNEKKERGDRLIKAPAIDVASGVIQKTADLSARKAAEKWWNENVEQPLVFNTEVGDVEINDKSIKDSLAHRYRQPKLDAITSLPDGFGNAVYLGTMKDFTRDGDVNNHYFAYPINYDGQRNYVFCRAMQDANKNRLYVHEVFVADKINEGNTLQTTASQPHGGIALYKEILANVLSAAKIDNSSETTKKNGEKFSLKDEKTLAGVHNITEEKLRKALKLGGFANPSLAVIDTNKTGHDNFGEISFIAPSALLDKRTGNTGGTWITDAYTQRYPSVEREMSEKGSQKFRDWVDSLEYPSEAKAEIKRQAEDALSNNNAPAWELMYLKEKGIDIKEYDSRIDYRWKEIISDHPTAEDILNSMQTDPELNEKVTSLAKHAIIHPTWEKVSLEVRRKMYEETGVKASPINPQVRKQTKEIFERDYAPTLLNKDGSPRKKDVKKVVEDIVKEHNDTKKYDFYLSKVKASNYVNKNGLYDDYIRWQENKLDEFGTKNRIFRGYTKDGSRKYVPETLENVSKVMREEADGQTNGSEYTSFGSFIAKLASRVDSTDEMRANKDKLSSNKDKEEFYEKWSEVYYDLAKFLYNDVFYGEQRLHDIVLQSDPKKYAKKEYGITLTPTFMKKLDALKNAVQTELKSAYFETKYNRPLRLNEFAAAVVPDNLGEDVRKGIENAGLPMYDYDPNKEGDRSRAFNEAINSSDNIRFSLAGERGAAAADKAEERTARMDNLSVARKMEEEKKDAKAIKMATGWERGADGKWRYEMPDAKIKDTMDVGGGHIVKRYEDDMLWNGGKLSNVIDAPELFKAYPQLKDVRIDTDAIMNDMPSNGEYNSKTNTITIHADELKYMNGILNHEIQHVIQDIEGFAKGGSPRLVRGEVKKRFDEVTKQIKQLRAEGKEDEAKTLIEKNRGLYNAYQKNDDFNSYKSLAGEVEARNVSARLNMTPEERRKTLAESTEDVARKDQIFLGVGDVSFSLRDMADGKESGAADMAEDLKSLNTPDEVDDAIKTAIDDMPSGWKMANKKMIHIAQALGENRKTEIAGEEPKFSLKDGTLIKAGTYFSGGGLVEEGLKGIIDPVVAVEYDEKISGVYRNNFGQHIVTADVRDVDPKELVEQIDGEVEYFHASPVCKNYSQAKSNHAEVELDKETAASTAEFINAIKPKVVTIENVKGYKDSDAMKTITDALDANGYTWDADVYNAADYGGYTNRERLIVRAVRDGKLPEKPKKMARKSGWYEAVADIIPTLTEKKNGVAPWMDVRLKADGIDWRKIDKPLYVMGSAYADGKVPHAFADELLPTLRTKSGDVIVMPDGKVYRAMGRVLARVSGVSDDYKMPFSENLSHTIIGNGIPTQLTEHVIAPLLQNTLRPTTPEDGNTKFSLRYDQFEHDLNQWKKDNNLPKDAKRPTIPQRNAGESAVDFLRRVDEYRKQMALWKTAPTYEQHLLSDDTALGEFNRELQRGSVLKRIAFQDSMLAIRKAQEAIMKEVGVDRLNMAEDAYTAENRSHGKGKNEFEEYNNEFLQPLRKAYHQMKKILGDSYDNVRIYMMAKHGLERDAQMAFKKSLEADYEDVAQRSAAYKAYKGDMNRIANDSDLEFGRVDFNTWRQRDNALRTKYSPSYMDYRYDENGIAYDYSGLSALFGGSDFEEAAHKLVRDIENSHVAEVQDLWNATNAATKKILRDGYKAGMMSKDTYQYVRDMYSHYIPLRGWDGTTADQVWDYIGGGKGAFNQTLKTAHGRTSIADDPIAYIENMAESGILLNNKNWVKQHLMLLAQNHPTSLLTLSKAWYVKSTDANGNEEWIPATPQITSQMDSNQVKAAIDAFEKKMEQMAQTGDATQKRDGLNIAYPQTHSEEREHEVRVMKDGEEYVIYVNGDPQLAQAMNNTRAHRVREIQSGKLDRAAAWLGRKMAAAYTSLSPLFIPSNYFRDLTMTLASTAIREDAKYNYLLRKNLATSWNLGFMLRDYQNGKLREKVSNGNATPKEQMFYDFMMNGSETGFVSSLDVEDLKKKFKNDLKDLDRWKTNPVKVGHTIMDAIEFLNRAIEDSNRFAVYMTSIQYGRSIDEAVNDAKDVTLNFNRKGTGEYGWQMVRNLYLFINPAVQSLQTLGALAKHHPFKFTAVTASWLVSGVLVPLVNAALMNLLGGDDDKDKYWQFTKWDRRNNLIMWVPFTHEYVKIPLAQEFRAFYGVGDMIASKVMGGELAEESWSQYAEDLLGQVVDMLPLDPTGYDGNIAVSLMPNAIRPVFELAFNVDFTGKPLFKDTEYNKYDPNFTKAYVGTPDWLVRASKMVNSIGNDYPDVQQNSIDAFGDPRYNLNNPAVVDHVLSSYLGGAYTMGSQVLGVLTKSLNDPKEIKVADIPLFSKFVSNPDDRPVTKKQGDEFWDMKENHDRAANTLSKLKKQAKVDGDYSMLERFYDSEEYKQYKQDDVKVKKYEEDKKKERAEESGEEYRPHKLNAEDIYKAHATPKDDFEDLKLKQLYTKLNGFKTSYDLLVDTAPSQSDGYYNTNKAAIDAIDEISLDKQEISELKKGFLDDGKDSYNAEDMKQIRELRKKILAVLEKANKVVVANQKAKAKK
nr:MAG TPA: cytosine DNA methyltransferase [Caudoviricetes sp.]